MSRNNRRFKNFLLVPESQIRFGMLFLACSSAIHIALTVAALSLYMTWISSEQQTGTAVPAGLIMLAIIAIYVILQAFAFVLSLVMSHRLFGPLVPLTRMVEDMKKGQYKNRVHLREKDEPKIKDFAKSLNELAEVLEKKEAGSV